MDIRATAIGLVCTALAAVLLNGCTTVPVTGRSQLMFYGEKAISSWARSPGKRFKNRKNAPPTPDTIRC